MEGMLLMPRSPHRNQARTSLVHGLRGLSAAFLGICLLLAATPVLAETDEGTTHNVMALTGEAIELASETIDNVYARVLVSDVREDMKKLKSAKTHLMAVRFFNAETDEPIPQGYAALYLKNDHNKAGFFDPMSNKDGIFVAGLLLIKPGTQQVIIASKLLDRKSRDFHISFTLVE